MVAPGLRPAFWFFLAFAPVFFGCASYTDDTKEIRSLYRRDAFEPALEKIESSTLKDQSRNRLLYLLEKAMIEDRLNRLPDSRKSLFAADQLADRLYTTSISKEALTYIYNESAQDYAGEDYEKVGIHTVLAMSFLQEGDQRSAMVEARKINNKLVEINNQYDDKKNRYGEDAFARYLAGVIYESQKEWDSAIIDYGKALELYEGVYQREFLTRAPDHLVASYYRLLKMRDRPSKIKPLRTKYKSILDKVDLVERQQSQWAEVVVVHEAETISTKVAKDFVMPFGRQIVRISFPTIRTSGYARSSSSTGLLVDGGKQVNGELVQNMDEIASKTLDDRRFRLVLKQGARLLAKGQLTDHANRSLGPLGGIAANIYAVVTETADTRGWTLMPGAYYITRVRLPAGKHKVVMKTAGRKSKPRTLNLKPGEIKILRHRH